MNEQINERVEVITVYNREKGAMPFKVRWQGRSYLVSKLAYYHKKRDGRVITHVFNVSTENIDMRLEFNSDTLHWILKEVTDGATN